MRDGFRLGSIIEHTRDAFSMMCTSPGRRLEIGFRIAGHSGDMPGESHFLSELGCDYSFAAYGRHNTFIGGESQRWYPWLKRLT